MDEKRSHPTHRFTKTIDYYHKYRPKYPQGVIDLLKTECSLDENSEVADVGSGTGIFTEQLLENGCKIHAVEPNKKMRECAEETLQHYPNFKSVGGTAENLPNPDNSVNVITAAQAFHWFDVRVVRTEFQRVLKQDGWVVLLWNFRDSHASPFMEAYEQLLATYGTDYKTVAAENISESDIERFFSPNSFQNQSFDNIQELDLQGLKGRLLSTSYTPKPADSNFEPMIHEAEKIFHECQSDGYVRLLYNTTVYYGHLH